MVSGEELEGGFGDYYCGTAWLLPLSASSRRRLHQLPQSLVVGSGHQPVNNGSSLYEMDNEKIIAATYGWEGITLIEAKEDSTMIVNILMIAIGPGTMSLKDATMGRLRRLAPYKRGIQRRNTPRRRRRASENIRMM